MKRTLVAMSQQYQAALARHLTRGPTASLNPARRLGRRAAALGLETLDLARIHEHALMTAASSDRSLSSRKTMITQAKRFFAEAITPIESTHRAALEASIHERQLNQALRQRTVESSASARHLKRGIAQRQAAEAALKKSGKCRARLLKESLGLQKHSRQLMREILATHEDEWQEISRQLHDEVAQILLGINVRLLTLKRAAKANTGNLKKQIASTQRLVKQSVRAINRFAHKFGLHHET